MAKDFEFNAPQFINFAEMDDPKADSFFDVNICEKEQLKHQASQTSTNISQVVNKENDAEIKEDAHLVTKNSNIQSSKKKLPILRKVLHEIVNQQIQIDAVTSLSLETKNKNSEKDIIQHFEKLHVSETKDRNPKAPIKATEIFNNLTEKKSTRKSHQMITRLDIMQQRVENKSTAKSLEMNDSFLSEDYNAMISDEKISSTTPSFKTFKPYKRNGSPLHPPKKFISLAEQIEHFHKDTPERFRSKPKNLNSNQSWAAKSNCLPKTPKLTARYRQRKIDYPSEKEREELELEEIKKHQVKANPLNEKILLGPSLNLKIPVIKKPTTVPQPFSLTEVKKKDPPQEPVYHFKAQPVPTVILQGPVGIPPRKVTSPTKPTTPQIRVPLRFRIEAKTADKTSSTESLKINTPRNTKIEPFSFDVRIKEMMQKKEEFVKKVIEEEKKNFNSFKANPMPSFKSKNDSSFKQNKTHHKLEVQPFKLTEPKINKSFSESQEVTAFKLTPFKARPAKVVHQEPFVPKIERHDLLLPSNIQLHTEKRAMERQKFDEKIKQKEEENAKIMKLQKLEEERLEKEKMLEERKKLEFKANPMPRFKAFEIHGSDPEKLTFPQSPMFSFKKREMQKQNHLDEKS